MFTWFATEEAATTRLVNVCLGHYVCASGVTELLLNQKTTMSPPQCRLKFGFVAQRPAECDEEG